MGEGVKQASPMKNMKYLLVSGMLSSGILLCGAQIRIDFENPDELSENWVQTFGAPDSFAQVTGSGTGGSTGVQYIDDDTSDHQVNSVYQTSLGPFQDGLLMYAKVRFEQVGSNNVFHMGFTTDPNGVTSLSTAETTADWIGLNLTSSSNFLSFRAEIYGMDHDGGNGSGTVLLRSGAGHPESWVAIPGADGVNPVNLWLGLEVKLISLGNGNWDVQSTIDLLNGDGTAVVTEDYAVMQYSTVGGLEDGHTTHPPLDGFSDLYNASDLYAFIGSQRGALRNFAGVDDILISVPESGSDWYGFAVDALGWTDTDTWLGWVNVTFAPWIWSESLAKYIYVADESGWVYITR